MSRAVSLLPALGRVILTGAAHACTTAAALNAEAAADNGRDDQKPDLVTDGAGTRVAVWDSRRAAGDPALGTDRDILFARSTDGSATWPECGDGERCDDGASNETASSCCTAACTRRPSCPCSAAGDCEDRNDCTVDTCEAAACVHRPAPNGARCEDGQSCTVDDACSVGVSVGIPECGAQAPPGGLVLEPIGQTRTARISALPRRLRGKR